MNLSLADELRQRRDDVFMRREHLKRQYLRYYKMEKIIKNKQKAAQVAKIKRQLLKMMGRE